MQMDTSSNMRNEAAFHFSNPIQGIYLIEMKAPGI